ncbi:MAG: glutathione S-transferase N-terminal domain-containing protein [Myxococcota bacterium]
MVTLYYSPGACSLVPHILLQERELPHQLVRVSTGDEEHKRPEYLAINPLGRVPALRTDDGDVLTEVIAISHYLGEGFVPTDALARARHDELLALFASSLHPAYIMALRPDRVVPDPGTHEAVRNAGRERFLGYLADIERRAPEDGWLLGERYTVADPYLFVIGAWGRYIGMSYEEFPRLRAIMRKVRQRPAVLRALHAEGLIGEDGRATPPARA